MIKIKILGVFANQNGRAVKIKVIGGAKESMTAYVGDLITIGDHPKDVGKKRKKFNLILFIRNLLE